MKNRTIATALVTLALSFGVADQALNVQPSKVEASEFTFTQQQQEALDHLNGIRANMGLDPVELDPYLNKAAQNHADYLSVNGNPFSLESHRQDPSKTGFTGVTASD
ncbi:CAP domain-containing protein [Alkalihalobacillus oceani]|uniref:CAP domain-containing protein n=1 Tax=Halalkalibacter oceani TaxID=1653776 RepID=A0A9X2DNE2_9BACI|nr:CAP domain-containing protein [Halalkalibacter oceani]MCM3714101.1 CAP domain-containing protein [Halalkalibacter oceani]